MKIINRENENIFNPQTRRQVLVNLLAPCFEEFVSISDTLNELIEKYKNVPLKEYIPTDAEKKRMEEDPGYALDIPKYYVPGYDEEVNSTRFEQKIRDEFYTRWENKDNDIYKFINENNRSFKIVF